MKNFIYIVVLLIIIYFTGSYTLTQLGVIGGKEVTVSTEVIQFARVGIQSVKPLTGSAAVGSKNAKIISWETSGFPADSGVDINLIKKISDSPASYTFVRKIAEDTTNDGSEVWIPKSDETGNNMYIEVTCGSKLPNCKVTGSPLLAN